MLKSWKTSLAGIGTFIAVLTAQLPLLWDNDPGTNPDWNLIVGGFIALFGLLSARDNDVTSEEAKG